MNYHTRTCTHTQQHTTAILNTLLKILHIQINCWAHHPSPISCPLDHKAWATCSPETAFYPGLEDDHAKAIQSGFWILKSALGDYLYINVSHEVLTISRFYSLSLTSEPADMFYNGN